METLPAGERQWNGLWDVQIPFSEELENGIPKWIRVQTKQIHLL